MSLATLQKKISKPSKVTPGLAKGKWKYPKDINAFDNEVAEDFKEYMPSTT